MKAASIKQPWAGLIAAGIKTIEVRSWPTQYRGPLLICVSKKAETAIHKYFKSSYFGHQLYDIIDKWGRGPMQGMAVCIVDLTNCTPLKDWNDKKACLQKMALDENFPGKKHYAWKLENVRLIEPFEVKGQLGLFEVDNSFIKLKEVEQFPEYLAEPIFKVFD